MSKEELREMLMDAVEEYLEAGTGGSYLKLIKNITMAVHAYTHGG